MDFLKDESFLSITLPERMEGETAAVMTATMASGALSNLSINWFTTINSGESGLFCELIHVCGDKGEAFYTDNRGTYYKQHNAGQISNTSYRFDIQPQGSGFSKVEPKDNRDGIERCVTEWVDTLRNEGGHMLTPGRDSRRTVEVAEAAYRSYRTKRFINLPIEAEPWTESR